MAMVDIKLDLAALGKVSEAAKAAALETMEAVRTDLIASQTMPFGNGTTQGSLYVTQLQQGRQVHTPLGTDTLYARFLYYELLMLAANGSAWARKGEHKTVTAKPLNFQKGKNPNAGGHWYAPYLKGGAKESFITDTYAARLKEHLK